MRKILLATIAILAILTSCEPRIEFDEGQWGDHAYIDVVHVFTALEEEHELNEFYTDSIMVTGIKRKLESIETEVDSLNAIATVKINAGADRSNMGIIFSHRSKSIEPLDGSPMAGILSDFSEDNGPFKYRLHSADGTTRDWEVILIE
ncbi:hypothetical protein EYV94_24615 [Puteibacter caeruleilacunae]|nr:hypothetical protein EYV94_24615 [Puteibacter caeruleilacunae]